MFLKVLVFVLKIARMFDLKMSKELGTIYLLKSLSSFFLSFDIAILPLILQEALSLDIKGRAWVIVYP